MSRAVLLLRRQQQRLLLSVVPEVAFIKSVPAEEIDAEMIA